ncbi:MAG TPA: Gfo/Idh/MocA family oxidoreductase [Clostridiales bacterium]|nr:Gfo/Idh/MocA family oxidoreductase [Clostridiales bacterium]
MKKDGMTYSPKGKPNPVVKPGEFVFSAIALDHGHIYGMCNGLMEAGATLKYVYDPNPEKVKQFLATFPQAQAAASKEQVLQDADTRLIAAAAITNLRCPLGIEVMAAGKDYFTDKAPLTTLGQLEQAKKTAARTGRKYMVYYSERIHNEGAIFAGELISQNAIGRVLQVIGLGPHRLNAKNRPDWFFIKEQYGGILCDIGSHQIEQFLYYTGAKDAQVTKSQIANYAHPEYPELDDFGEAMLVGDNGCTNYFRVDWFTPDGLRTWGDGRAMILGTDGYIEIRKYIDVATDSAQGDHVILVNSEGEQRFCVTGQVGFPFFGAFILDCINRTEHAMTQAHAFKAAELCVRAQMQAQKIR